ncbi:MAG: RluA family pseudouridine synthase [Balneolaceae bacterium]
MITDIIYEDNHLLVINKPAGVLSQPDGSDAEDILSYYKHFLKKRDQKPGNVFLGLVHRLDRPVGGVMVLAKTSKAASRLSDQIRRRTVKKTYLIVTEGRTPKHGVLEGYITKNKKLNKVTVTSKAGTDGKHASLTYITKHQTDQFSFLEIDLQTGRPHQIRAQMAAFGFPVWGDQKYGAASAGPIALFSHRFHLLHPTQKTALKFQALPPSAHPWALFTSIR